MDFSGGKGGKGRRKTPCFYDLKVFVPAAKLNNFLRLFPRERRGDIKDASPLFVPPPYTYVHAWQTFMYSSHARLLLLCTVHSFCSSFSSSAGKIIRLRGMERGRRKWRESISPFPPFLFCSNQRGTSGGCVGSLDARRRPSYVRYVPLYMPGREKATLSAPNAPSLKEERFALSKNVSCLS